MATDMEVGVRVQLPEIVVEAPGSCLLPVKRFMDIVRESVDVQMRISSDQQGTTVRGERSQFRLASSNADEFPSLAAVREERCHQVTGRLFHELVHRTAFATDTESSRYALAGVLLEFGENNLVAVGTDGRRLAKMEVPALSHGNHHAVESTTIVPTRAIQLMSRAFSNPEAEIRITARNNDILVQDARVHDLRAFGRGRFPRCARCLPGTSGRASNSAGRRPVAQRIASGGGRRERGKPRRAVRVHRGDVGVERGDGGSRRVAGGDAGLLFRRARSRFHSTHAMSAIS